MREFSGMLDGTFASAPQAGPWMDTGGEGYSLVVMVQVTAVSGAPAATFVLEDTDDPTVAPPATALQTVTGVSAVGTYALRQTGGFARYVRVRETSQAATTSITTATKGIARD